jgi:fumarate reductase flavoprotein subunit
MIHTLGGPPLSNNPFLRVNAMGERYENEDVAMPHICSGAGRQPGNVSWVVFDTNYAWYMPRMGSGFSRESTVSATTATRIENAVKAGTLQKADTVEELAAKIKVPADNLKATVDRYNELASLGRDLDFGKNPARLTLTNTPPFYAGKVPLGLLVVVGGLDVNPRLQVLDKEGGVIPGLYAAGNVAGNFFADMYPAICPGLSHGKAFTEGRLAGLRGAAETA